MDLLAMSGWFHLAARCCFALSTIGCCAAVVSCQEKPGNTTTPDHFKTLVVYDANGLGEDVTEQELDAVPYAALDAETTAAIFKQVTWKAGNPLWKGSCLGVANLEDGTKRRVAISNYGGFFVVLGESGYYTAEGESRIAFDAAMKNVLIKTFIPSRKSGLGRSDHKAK
jgi:hypothetical protein